MIDHVDPPALIVGLVFIVVWWIGLKVRDRIRARRARAADVAERIRVLTADRVAIYRLCPRMWHAARGEWVVCSRPHEHTGPHFNEWTGDLER